MPEPSTPDELLISLARALNHANIGYVVVGGQAVIRHGEPRHTQDIDITVIVPPYEPEAVLRLAARLHLQPRVDDPESLIRRAMLLPLHHAPSDYDVDIAFGDSEYQRLTVERADRQVVEGVEVVIASVEDLLIQKLIAYRGRDQDDVIGLLHRHPNADLMDVRHWLKQFEAVLEEPLVERLDEMLAQQRRLLGER